MSTTTTSSDTIQFDVPRKEDGAPLAELIHRCAPLEPNTTYAYLLFCTHFAESCVLARDEEGLVGAIVGYRPPTHPEAIFVWQIAVDERGRGKGLGGRMLSALVDRLKPQGVTTMEATVAPSNTASDRLFHSFAKRNGFPIERVPYFTEDLFGVGSHEEELLYQIRLTEA